MKKTNILILAAGFGTRMYPLTLNIPKALVNVSNKPIIEHILEKIEKINSEKKIFIYCNKKFYSNFLNWKKDYKGRKDIEILHNEVMDENESKGAVNDIKNALNEMYKKEKGDVFVLACDNLFDNDLNLLLEKSRMENSSVMGLRINDNLEMMKKYSCILLDKNNKIIDFEEKPQNPKSKISGTAIYYYKEKDVKKVLRHDFKDKKNMGDVVEYLIKDSKVYGVIFEGIWIDIGSIQGLDEANIILKKK